MRIWALFVLATAFAALGQTGVLSAQEMDRHEVITECTDTINRYAHTRDQLDAEGHANLFTEDGEFEFGGSTTTGREAIAQRIRDNDGSQMTRHMGGSIVVSIDDNGAITAHSYFHIFQADRSEAPGPVPVGSYLVVEYDDEMRMTAPAARLPGARSRWFSWARMPRGAQARKNNVPFWVCVVPGIPENQLISFYMISGRRNIAPKVGGPRRFF